MAGTATLRQIMTETFASVRYPPFRRSENHAENGNRVGAGKNERGKVRVRQIRYFDMFAGAGGFQRNEVPSQDIAKAGDLFLPVGWCEIDKYAQRAYRALYNTEGEYFCDDARKIDPALLPDIYLICGGFPAVRETNCTRDFSVAGKRGGFEDARGTLFFEITRIAAVKKPAVLLLENVPGLLNHDGGRTFAAILSTLSELGYDVAWQVLNSKDFGVPQARKRVYLVGSLGERCPGEVFSFTETNGMSPRQLVPGREGNRIYSPAGVSVTFASTAGGFAGRTGLYDVNPNLQYSFIDLNPPPTFTVECRCLTTRQDVGIGTHKGERSGVFVDDASRAVMNPARVFPFTGIHGRTVRPSGGGGNLGISIVQAGGKFRDHRCSCHHRTEAGGRMEGCTVSEKNFFLERYTRSSMYHRKAGRGYKPTERRRFHQHKCRGGGKHR